MCGESPAPYATAFSEHSMQALAPCQCHLFPFQVNYVLTLDLFESHRFLPLCQFVIPSSFELRSERARAVLILAPRSDDIRRLEAGQQVVVGTPGRVYDMINRRALRTDSMRIFVLDEADEMLSRGSRSPPPRRRALAARPQARAS